MLLELEEGEGEGEGEEGGGEVEGDKYFRKYLFLMNHLNNLCGVFVKMGGFMKEGIPLPFLPNEQSLFIKKKEKTKKKKKKEKKRKKECKKNK